MAAGYTGKACRISNDDLLDCLHAKAYQKRKLDAISVEESLCSIARSVDLATHAADMARFADMLFDDMCEFVAEVGISDFFMVGGDFRGAWKSEPAQRFTGIFLDAISPEDFRQACTSQLLVNDGLYSQAKDLF